MGNKRKGFELDNVYGAGDLNGDGYSDIIVTGEESVWRLEQSKIDPWRDDMAHMKVDVAYIVFGGGREAFPTDLKLGGNEWQLSIDAYRIYMDLASPTGLTSLGDVNDDGFDDFAVNLYGVAPDYGTSGYSPTNDMVTQVVFGSDHEFFELSLLDDLRITSSLGHTANEISKSVPGFRIIGDDGVTGFYHTLADVGDITGDGISDILIGTPYRGIDLRREPTWVFTEEVGGAYIVPGKQRLSGDILLSDRWNNPDFFSFVNGAEEDGKYGITVSGLGDINNDEIVDFVVQTPQDNGTLHFYFGGSVPNYSMGAGHVLPVHGATLHGFTSRPFNQTIAPVGDFNSDGVDDYVIGHQNWFDFGARGGVDLFLGFNGPPTPDPVENIVLGDSDSDVLVGTAERDVIISGGGRYDKQSGGAGADDFVFGSETSNSMRERDVISDYEIGVDRIVLSDGASVSTIRQTSSQVVVLLEGDRDAIYVRGEGVTADNLTIVSDDALDFIL